MRTRMTTPAERCPTTITWTPTDGETGRVESERTERCSLDAGHPGYHLGEGGPFGPLVAVRTRPEIVVLCGSTRFYETFRLQNLRLTLEGKIVLSIGYDGKSDADLESAGMLGATPDKVALDELHKRKIDLADRVLVLNVGGYIGESTLSEVNYARAHGKPVDWLEPEVDR